MLAAISGLLYLITATLGIDGSFLFSYMLPFPIVVASARRGHGAAWSTMGISASLVLGATTLDARVAKAARHKPADLLLILDDVRALIYGDRVSTQ